MVFTSTAKWYISNIIDDIIPYGINTYFVLLLSWLSFCFIFQCIEATGKIDHLKLQPEEKTSGKIFWQGCKDSAFNWLWMMILVPLSGSFFKVMFPVNVESIETLQFLKIMLISMLIFDFWFYVFHRTLHVFPTLYIRFHKPHHIYKATFVFMSHAQHPVEIFLNAIGTLAGPLIYNHLIYSEPVISLTHIWCWMSMLQLFGVLDHCGYNLPINPFFIFHLPFLTTIRDHDIHHMTFNKSYGGILNIWDTLGGTRA